MNKLSVKLVLNSNEVLSLITVATEWFMHEKVFAYFGLKNYRNILVSVMRLISYASVL